MHEYTITQTCTSLSDSIDDLVISIKRLILNRDIFNHFIKRKEVINKVYIKMNYKSKIRNSLPRKVRID